MGPIMCPMHPCELSREIICKMQMGSGFWVYHASGMDLGKRLSRVVIRFPSGMIDASLYDIESFDFTVADTGVDG
jgi:hypothetical protein